MNLQRIGLAGTMAVATPLFAACITPPDPRPGSAAPLAIHGSQHTVEIAPVLLTAHTLYGAEYSVRDGGIPNLVGVTEPSFGEAGVADIATHAETQALRYSVDHPGVRIILTVTEGHYRIVARRSAGIERIADLEGKRIATLAPTSAGYFLGRMLARAGLTISDVDAIRVSVDEMDEALANREVDAVAIWEPFAGNAAEVLGEDIVEFSGEGIYRELFNLNSTAANLADPAKRARIVAFVRALIDASEQMGEEPGEAQALVAAAAGFRPDEIVRSWPYLSFPAALPDDLLDVLVEEELWLAEQSGRPPRSREELSGLIDPSIYEEALTR
ncbi:ABC transporter substrate-binding protein [Parasphingopyxis marina]|uniref:ABC transporter substrate-binding protein n=1 Tax=Parasphingopyxis marina TaxID=2761622 RepID=A0A842I1U7_9SPHN|nr:ABC transporter substrate-binding protein [Parasphingopyxis marina]MBC2778887.1 ABC transporter substrate-binding protein [Parasphingopyxis marina]